MATQYDDIDQASATVSVYIDCTPNLFGVRTISNFRLGKDTIQTRDITKFTNLIHFLHGKHHGTKPTKNFLLMIDLYKGVQAFLFVNLGVSVMM